MIQNELLLCDIMIICIKYRNQIPLLIFITVPSVFFIYTLSFEEHLVNMSKGDNN